MSTDPGRRGAVAMSCVELSKRFGGVVALDNVTLDIRRGQIMALVGPNGAGKSTLIDVLTGFVPADAGRVHVDERRLRGGPWRRARDAQLRRTFQHPSLAMSLTVQQNVLLGCVGERFGTGRGVLRSLITPAARRSMRSAEQAVKARAGELAPTGRATGALSTGDQRMTELARALSADPAVVFVDEPFAGADDDGISRMCAALVALAEAGRAVVVVDHHVDLLADIAHRLVLMFQGKVIFDGPPGEGLRSKQMRTIYFGDPDDE